MRSLQEKVLVIVPCYNEEERLHFAPFKEAPSHHYFLFVNDGSADGTSEMIRKQVDNNIMLYDLPHNMGKAEAVRHGFIHARSLPVFNEIGWIGYWDADLATPLSEIDQYLLYREYFAPQAEAIFGSRVLRMGGNITRTFSRHLFGRFFATVISNLFNLNSYDTQCGAKLFRKELTEKISKEAFISRWIFDVEVILRLKGHNLVEYPLDKWVDVAGSKLKVGKVAFNVLRDIWKIRKRYEAFDK